MAKHTKGIIFYAEMPDGWKSKSGCKDHKPFTRATLKEAIAFGQLRNCIAVLQGREHRCYGGTQECLSAVFSSEDSDTNLTSVSRDYLRMRCVKVSADMARKLHPRLLARIEGE